MLEELITKETFQWSEEVLDWQKAVAWLHDLW